MKEDNFIPGIYNYCDRWCERCDLAHRCKLFYHEQKQLAENDGKDDFIEIVSQNLEKTVELLQDIAEEKGFDLEDIKADDDAIEQEQEKFKDAQQHPMVLLTQSYLKETIQWFEDHDHLEPEKNKFLKNIDLGIQLDESDKALRIIDEAISILNWYKFQMTVKLTSAIHSYPHDPRFEDKVQNRHHASAKIVLIGVQNSMKALQSLLEIIQDDDGKIVDRLLELHRLQKMIHQHFPLLHQFKRPGFDY